VPTFTWCVDLSFVQDASVLAVSLAVKFREDRAQFFYLSIGFG
jgi:hypothetical protein